ncbi:MAG: ABC transporter ATP-binding protein [Proteobacteria bacterium]|nr:ABC transporter ATP-binding protein [Pseudomonadota bacterium]
MLQLQSLAKTYGTGARAHQALKGVDLEVRQGEFFTLVGPSGCGKTTALRCVAGLETPTSGDILLGGEPVFSSARRQMVPANRRDVSMVFQSYAIWPHMTVQQNVEFPLEVQRVPTAERRKRALQALEMVGLAAVAERPATNLSGGQQQRVSLARAIVRGAKLLLLDEPLSNLDAELRVQMRSELRQLQQQLGVTTLFVTHDQEEAMSMSDRVAVFDHGVLVEIGTPQELYMRPRHQFTATFLGLSDLLDCTVRQTSASEGRALLDTAIGPVLATAPNPVTGDNGRLLIRPEHIVLATGERMHALPSQNSYVGHITHASFSGRYVDYDVQVAGRALRVQTSSAAWHGAGTEVGLHLPPEHCVLLAA